MGNVRVSRGSLRLVLLAFAAVSLLLIPAARASADFTLSIELAGTGEGWLICEVETEEEAFEEECEEGEYEYPEGAEVTIFPEAEFGSEFVEFSGACNLSPCALTMDEEHEVTAIFDLEEFALTIETNGGPGTGTVKCELQEGPEPCKSEYPGGTEINLIADPDPGSEIIDFSGSCEAFGSECELIIEEDSTVTVAFHFVGPKLTINTNGGSGTGTVKCGADGGALEPCAPAYPELTELVLVATADSGSQFAGWSAPCTEDPCELPPLEGDTVVTATFNLEPTTPSGGEGESEPDGTLIAKTPAPAPGKLSVSGAALFQGGKAVLRLSCKGQGPCKGSLKLVAKLKVGKAKAKNVEIGKISFSLAAGASQTLKVKLAGAAKKLLGKAKNVKATVSGVGVTKSTVTIKPTAR